MKIIFLDFDGVLNSVKYLALCGEYGVVLNPAKMQLLKQIVDATDAKIVLSTSWREHWFQDPVLCTDTGRQINERFDAFGLKIYDKTPRIRLSREAEIRSWLLQHPEVRDFLVLDDMFLSADFLQGRFIRTSNYIDGLEQTDVQRAIAILNGKE